MGPHSFKCGSAKACVLAEAKTESFNGAALFQVRKFSASDASIVVVTRASMGPHSFKCGSYVSNIIFKKKMRGLQWGRTLSSAEVRTAFPSQENWCTLQWGRTLSSAEVTCAEISPPRLFACFNGAALFQVRKLLS